MRDELAAIRWELWDLLRAVRDEEIEPEAAETVIYEEEGQASGCSRRSSLSQRLLNCSPL